MALAASQPLLETLRWTAKGAEFEALSSQPSACLAFDASNKAMVDAGQALFNTPTLLGGQAAKAGLSCASCHVNGRNNPHFMLAGVSDKPGTSDVTNSFFSAARGNGRFDPVSIPDLAAPGKISRDPQAKALEPFIRSLIVDEFSGAEPSAATLEALATYVRAIKSCEQDRAPRTLADQLLLIDHAMVGAKWMAKQGDWQGARLLIAAARHQLGVISERFSAAKFKRERAMLLEESSRLQHIAKTGEDAELFKVAADFWQIQFDNTTVKRLKKKEAQSLYNPKLFARIFPQKE